MSLQTFLIFYDFSPSPLPPPYPTYGYFLSWLSYGNFSSGLPMHSSHSDFSKKKKQRWSYSLPLRVWDHSVTFSCTRKKAKFLAWLRGGPKALHDLILPHFPLWSLYSSILTFSTPKKMLPHITGPLHILFVFFFKCGALFPTPQLSYQKSLQRGNYTPHSLFQADFLLLLYNLMKLI